MSDEQKPARTMNGIVTQMLGSQAMQIATLTARNNDLVTELETVKRELTEAMALLAQLRGTDGNPNRNG
jgi:hypothetical protein